MLSAIDIFFSVQLGVVAYVISALLMKQGMLLEFYLDFLTELENLGVSQLFTKPLGMCEKCLAGQIAMWVWIINHSHLEGLALLESIFLMVIYISFAILTTHVLKKYAK